MEVGGRQGKTPIFVKDVPGFFVNRCLSPFSVEVSALVMEGVELETLDKAMRSYGMPVGPITLSGTRTHIFALPRLPEILCHALSSCVLRFCAYRNWIRCETQLP